MTFWHFYCLGYYQSSRFQAVIRLPRRNGVQDVQLPHLSASAIGTSGDYYNSTWHERWPADSSAQGWITVIQCRTAHRLRPTRSSSESKINWLASCYNSRECLMLVHCSDHFIGCRSVKESSLKSQLCYIRYALLLIQRICTRCCRTTSVNPQQRAVGISAASTSTTNSNCLRQSQSLHQLYETVCLLTLGLLTLHY